MNKIALITGATSMDGRTMAHFLLSKNYKVILTYRRTANLDLENIKTLYIDDLKVNPKSSLDFIFMDIADQSSVRLAIKSVLEDTKFGSIDEFYNFSAQSHVFESFKNPQSTMITNGVSMFYILEALKDFSPKTRVFQACTSEMFGGNPERCPFDENSSFETRSPYAVAKKVAYDWVTYFRQTYGMFSCAAFCFNHSNIYRGPNFFIQKACLAATRIFLGKQKELVLGNLDFARDESLSDFCVEAFWKMLQLEKPEDFVIGIGRAYTADEFLNSAFGKFNLNWRDFVKQDKALFRDNEVVKLVANPQKAINLLGWNPNRITLDNHIGLMCDHNMAIENNFIPKRINPLLVYP